MELLTQAHIDAVLKDGFRNPDGTRLTLAEFAQQVDDAANGGVCLDCELVTAARQWLADKAALEAAGMDVDIDTRRHVSEAARATARQAKCASRKKAA